MSGNKFLHQAKRQKKDEFYTQLSDIEKELRHYKDYFRGKVVLCNCNDGEDSNFYRYFFLNFEQLGLKKLIGVTYRPYPTAENPALRVTFQNGVTGIHRLKEDGDFRSAESIDLLKEADIVVTNPPFSLFREYIAQLMGHEKKFLVLGNMNAVTTKGLFSFIEKSKLWYGVSIRSGDREFEVPEDYPLTAVTSRVDTRERKYVRVKGVRWFTNLDHEKRYEELVLYKNYSLEEYPTYDNYDAINVNKTKDIPKDYAEAMGVPITFLDKHNPDQFDVVGLDYSLTENSSGKGSRFKLGGKTLYARIVIKNKRLV